MHGEKNDRGGKKSPPPPMGLGLSIITEIYLKCLTIKWPTTGNHLEYHTDIQKYSHMES